MNLARPGFVLGTCLLLAACGGEGFEGEASQGGGGASASTTATSSTSGDDASSTSSAGGSPDATTATGAGGSASSSTSASSSASTSASSGGGGEDGCVLTQDTIPTDTVNDGGCHVLERDASACADARKALGLSGYWLAFSCRVTLSVEGGMVKAATDGQPDYPSNYFPLENACHEAYAGAIQNPNWIAAQSFVIQFPLAPSTSAFPMMGTATVGLAMNGVPIFGNFAAPGDDIYKEAKTFDRCGAHPQMSGVYHYHAEPYSLSYDDGNFIGVMRDGYPIYGRRDMNETYPTLDDFGGHTGVTPDSDGAAVYHYHVNEQTSTSPGTLGQKQWFLTSGFFRGAPAACPSCN